MGILRFSLALLSVIAALFCAWEAYLIHYINSRHTWLAGPLQLCGQTGSPNSCIVGLGVLGIFFLSIAVYAIFCSKSGN